MNAQALKKFVEENQKLAMECANLLAQCKRWERECSLYDHDREALMDFGNEADERAKEAETRVHELEEEVKRLSDELRFYKCQSESQTVNFFRSYLLPHLYLVQSVCKFRLRNYD
jgi:chromosome segregation ATPase